MPSRGVNTNLIIASGCLIVMIGFGLRTSFGLFMPTMSVENGYGREVFALAIALQNLTWGIMQPFAGAIADRYGAGRVIATSAILYAGGMVLMANGTSALNLNVSQGLFIGVGLSGTTFAIVLSALARAVPDDKRSWALGIGTAAGSLGQLLIVPVSHVFLTQYGWSMALVLLSIAALAIVPLSAALSGRQAVAIQSERTLKDTLVSASQHRGYWYLTAGFFVCGFHLAFISTHLPAYLSDAGLAPKLGATVLATIGLFNIFGAYFSGVLGNKYSKRLLLCALYIGRSLVMLVFILVPLSNTSALVFGAGLGFLWLSTVPLTSGIVAQIFGPRYMATLFGIVFFSHQLGSFLGVWLGGRFYESTGSYEMIWWVCIVLGVVSAAVHWPIDERPMHAAPV